jgi:adenylate kinase
MFVRCRSAYVLSFLLQQHNRRGLIFKEENMNIILIGAQGSGKGTQAELLTQALGIPHVASGNLFRKALDENTPLGVQARAYMDRGELVPDEITIAMVLQCVERLVDGQGVLLDGFPRTIAQARALDRGLQQVGRQIDIAAYLDVPHHELLSRLSERYLCRAEQHIYHRRTRPPKVIGVCDVDGSALYQRSDDGGEAVHKRLDIFFHETTRVLDYYKDQDKLIEIDGNQRVDQVLTGLLDAVSSHMEKLSQGCC